LITIVDHPLIKHKLTLLRDKNTNGKDFRQLVREIATILAYEASRDFSIEDIKIETPFKKINSKVLSGKKVAVVAILRAGLGMVDGVLDLFPNARIGHFGLYRDPETLVPVEYYVKYLDNLGRRNILVVDPMLATGGTGIHAVKLLKKRGAKKISYLSILASKKGIEMLDKAHPDISIFSAGVDPSLNKDGFIVPGLGDAGDRLFGTKG